MGWRSERDDYLEAFERRSYGVITRDELWAIAVLCGEWPRDYDNESEQDWLELQRRARPIAREALGRIAPDIGQVGARRDLREERDALRTRLATIEAALRSEP